MTKAHLLTLEDLFSSHNISGKKILLRADFNVPMINGKVSDATRIIRTLPTIKELQDHGAKIIIISHFGRPVGEYDSDLTMAPIADALGRELGNQYIHFGVDCIGKTAHDAVQNIKNGEVILLENLRFHAQEKQNDAEFAQQLALLADFFVNDAFSVSHRAHASIVGVAQYLPSYAGRLLASEITHLAEALTTPEKPLAAIVGGSKVSTKIDLLENLVTKVQYLCVGGGMANTFLYAAGHDVGSSICEKQLSDKVAEIHKKADEFSCNIMLPTDLVIADGLKEGVQCQIVDVGEGLNNKMVLDIGPRTIHAWAHEIEKCKTLIWNGPLGAFEVSPFDVGTTSLSRVVSGLTNGNHLKTIAGGGDILAALQKAGLRSTFSYISTAGGAFLEWMEGKKLPGIQVLYK